MTEPEGNRCVADLDPDARYDSAKVICEAFPKKHNRGRRVSTLDVLVPCDPPPDVIFTMMSYCLIQDRVRRIFEEEHLTGFTTRPARARVERTRAPVSVGELSITGWGGMAPDASGIHEDYRCESCGHLHYSALENPKALVDVKNWDGSDFFMIWPLPMYRFVTKRVVEVCKKHGVTGVTFQRNYPPPGRMKSSGFTPGRLSYYMPEARAHALGDALGIF